MTFDDYDDPYDPVVAERFELLGRLTPPPVPAGDAADVGRPQPMPEPGVDRWRRHALIGMVAAALATLVGLSAVALSRGGGQGVEAIDAAPAPGENGGEAERSAGPMESGERIDATPSTLDASTVTEATPIVVDDSSSDDGPDGTGPETATTQATSPTTPQTTVPTTVGEPSTSPPSVADIGQVVTIQGVVTEVFTDCQSRLVLNAAGEVEEVGPVSCDGGSHIVVDGQRIQTSSGFGLPENAFDRHPRNLRPGKSVVVTAISGRDGRLSLDCEPCGLGR